jgi:hypothetical protein
MRYSSLTTIWRAGFLRRALPLAVCAALASCATEAPLYQAAMQAPVVSALPVVHAATLHAPPVQARQEPARTSTITPLDYYEWALAATPQELLAERLRLTTRRVPEDPIVDTVHLGILMSLSTLASRESEEVAIDLLQSVGNPLRVDDESREYAIFADFLLDHLQQRADLRAATSNIVENREELETLERNNRQLQEKIDALTSIEEQLIEREQAELPAESEGEPR